MSTLPSIVVVGLVLGSLIALRGVAFAVVASLLGEVNLAVGDAAVLGALAAVGTHERAGGIVIPILVGIGVGALTLLIVDVAILQALRGRGDGTAALMATLGAALMIRNIAEQTQGVADAGFPSLFGSASREVALTSVDAPVIVAGALVLVLAAAAAILLTRTHYGRAVLAVRSDPIAARVTGVPVTRVIVGLTLLSGGLSGLGAMVAAAHVGTINIQDGFRFTLLAYAATAIGGGRSLLGAVAGGLVLGMTESIVEFEYGQVWRDAASLGVLVVAFLIRPQGLAGRAAGQRI